MTSEKNMIRIEQVKSPIGYPKTQREVLRSLGLRRIRHVVEREDTPAVRCGRWSNVRGSRTS